MHFPFSRNCKTDNERLSLLWCGPSKQRHPTVWKHSKRCRTQYQLWRNQRCQPFYHIACVLRRSGVHAWSRCTGNPFERNSERKKIRDIRTSMCPLIDVQRWLLQYNALLQADYYPEPKYKSGAHKNTVFLSLHWLNDWFINFLYVESVWIGFHGKRHEYVFFWMQQGVNLVKRRGERQGHDWPTLWKSLTLTPVPLCSHT